MEKRLAIQMVLKQSSESSLGDPVNIVLWRNHASMLVVASNHGVVSLFAENNVGECYLEHAA